MPISAKLLMLVSLIYSGSVAYSQSYAEIKNQRVEIVSLHDSSVSSFQAKLYSFVGDDFDSLDVEILSNGPIVGALIVNIIGEKDSVTYGDIYEKWLEIKQIPDYDKMRSHKRLVNSLMVRPADLNNWEDDEPLLIELGFDDELLEKLKLYMEENTQPSETYETVLIGFRELLAKEKEEEKAVNRSEFSRILAVSKVIDEIELLYQSQDENKPILLYFTGWACVNCRKIEQSIFSEQAVNESIMENFIFQPLYVDDRTELPEEEQREVMLGERIMELKSVGDENSFYQMSRFEVSSQPYFVILNGRNEVLGTGDYFNSRTVDEFLSFLNKALTEAE